MRQFWSGQEELDAANWVARVASHDVDWEELAQWFDASPANRAAFDAMALLDADIALCSDSLRPSLCRPAPVIVHDAPRRWRIILPVAATITVLALGGTLGPHMLARFTNTPSMMAQIATGPGQVQSLVLTDGSRIEVDRRTRVRINDAPSPIIELASGSVNFSVMHDASRSFTVRVGEYEVRDKGTRFDVVRGDDRISVAVGSGAVEVSKRGMAGSIPVAAGERLDIFDRADVIKRSEVAPNSVGSWYTGRLVYDNAPLALVAADVSRYAGIPIKVDRDAVDMRFSGVLTIGDGSRLVGQLEGFLQIRSRRIGGELHFVRAH